MKLIVFSVGILALLATSCSKSDSSKLASDKSPSLNVLQVKASAPVVELWKSWGGKYVVIAHRVGGIKSLSDLEGRLVMCAYINTDEEPWVCDNVTKDLGALRDAAGIQLATGIQNNPDVYGKQLLEKPDAVGFMSAGIAKHYKFKNEEKLVEVVFVE